jgi:hypothetical protein
MKSGKGVRHEPEHENKIPEGSLPGPSLLCSLIRMGILTELAVRPSE